jgi:tetratricopeptide (TPR) repeat protein
MKLISFNQKLLICICLCLVIGTTFAGVHKYQFINFDDDAFVTHNPYVSNGLTVKGISWAFKFTDDSNRCYWMPITWLSHMLDSHLFGLDAGKHHLSNLFLHMLNACLLFWFLYGTTRFIWMSVFAAALFGIHPINVESVAWIAERKNLLSTSFMLLAIITYSRYVQKQTVSLYLSVVIFFLLGLMAKPMIVTLPFLLIILDLWPLNRLDIWSDTGIALNQSIGFQLRENKETIKKLLAEKVPLICISLLWVFFSLSSLKSIGSINSVETIPILLRVKNLFISYIAYIYKLLWPFDLSVYYPFPWSIPLWQPLAGGCFLLMVTLLAAMKWKSRPILLVGWLWYIGTFVPAIGLVQAGDWPAHADRFAYVPCIGIFMMIAWYMEMGQGVYKRYNTIKRTLAAMGLLLLMIISAGQLIYWKNSIALFDHAVRVTKNNFEAYIHLGEALYLNGQAKEAVFYYEKGIRIVPLHSNARLNLGSIYHFLGDFDKAIENFRIGLKAEPKHSELHFNLGISLLQKGDLNEAFSHFHTATLLKPYSRVFKANYHLAQNILESIKSSARKMESTLAFQVDTPDLQEKLFELTQAKTIFNNSKRRYYNAISKQSGFDASRRIRIKIPEVDQVFEKYVGKMSTLMGIVNVFPENAIAYYHLGCISTLNGDYQSALKWINTSIKIGLDDPVILTTDMDLAPIKPEVQKLLDSVHP